MSAPQIIWYEPTNTTQETSWGLGVVDAGTSDENATTKTFLIWNNRGGVTALSDMTNCTITTKDSAGGNTGELITNKWIQTKILSMAETVGTPIGGTTTKAIRAGGTVSTAGLIKGQINNGLLTGTGADCFAKVSVWAVIPNTATAGNVDFLLRVAYQFT